MIGWLPKTRDAKVASVRFRCLAPMTELTRLGFGIELYDEHQEGCYDAVIFSKLYDPASQKLARHLRDNGVSIILDLCDNHFYNPNALPAYQRVQRDMLSMIQLTDHVVCSTQALAEVVRTEAALPYLPSIVGDAVELDEVPARLVPDSDMQSLLWFGMHGSPNAPSGMTDLLNITAMLEELSKAYRFELVVASNCRAKFDACLARMSFPTRYVEWTLESLATELASASAVVIPITLNPFTSCKTSNRPATALYAGVPVIADPIPSYAPLAPFCIFDDWRGGLRAALDLDPELQAGAKLGQDFVRRTLTLPSVARQWRRVLSRFDGNQEL